MNDEGMLCTLKRKDLHQGTMAMVAPWPMGREVCLVSHSQGLRAKNKKHTFRFRSLLCYIGVSKNRGTPKWMVKIMENRIKKDDLEVPLFLETSIF